MTPVYLAYLFCVCVSPQLLAGVSFSKNIQSLASVSSNAYLLDQDAQTTIKNNLIDIVHAIQRSKTNLTVAENRFEQQLDYLVNPDYLSEILVEIVSHPLKKLGKRYSLRARASLLYLGKRVIRQGADIHAWNDEALINAAKNYPHFFCYLLKNAVLRRKPYSLAALRLIIRLEGIDSISRTIAQNSIEDLTTIIPIDELPVQVENLVYQLCDKSFLNNLIVDRVCNNLQALGKEQFIFEDLIVAVLQVRDVFHCLEP